MIDLVQPAFSAKLEFMLTMNPAECSPQITGDLSFAGNDERLRTEIVTEVASAIAGDQDLRKSPESVVQVGRKSQLAESLIDVWELPPNSGCIIESPHDDEYHVQNFGRAEGVRVIDR